MKQAFIMRGLPGSGKSTVARDLVRDVPGMIHSTDDYFMEGKQYKFDPSKLGVYHQENLRAFTESCKNGVQRVVCDNTNVLKEHMQPYVEAAKEHGYEVHIVVVGNFDVWECSQRNSHGVPYRSIRTMKEKFEL